MFIRRILSVIICCFTLSSVAFGQELYPSQPQAQKDCETGEFTAIQAGGNFQITLKEGPCAVILNADEALIPYIMVSVQDSTVFIEMDENAIPRDVKKIYRGRNAPVPILRASVSLPFINGLTATQNAVFSSNDSTLVADSIELSVTDKARLQDLKLEANFVKLRMARNAMADVHLDAATQLELSLDGSSMLNLEYKTRNLLMHQMGNSMSALDGETSTATFDIGGNANCSSRHKGNVLVVEAGGNSDINLTGEMGDMTLKATRMAKLNSLKMNTMRVIANINGWNRVYVNAQEFLSVNLSGGSALYYTGVPAIQVGKIVRSTFAPYEEEPEEK